VTIINDCEKALSAVNKVLHSKADMNVVEQKIEKYQLIDKIVECRKYGEHALPLVPHLLKVIKNEKSAKFPALIRVIVTLLGYLCPDGLITADLFKTITKSMHCNPDDIIRELEDRGYIINGTISPAFQPANNNFSFTISHVYDQFKREIKEILLKASKEISTTEALMDLLQNDALAEIHSDIIKALGNLGHPVAYPLLVEKAKTGNTVARDVVLSMCFRDINEFQYLIREGITKDLWGNDINEKVFLSIKQIIPLLFEALESESFPADNKKQLCFLFSKVGVKRAAELNVFVNILHELMEEEKEECFVTNILIKGGKQTVPYIIRYCKEGIDNPDVLNRFIFILGEIGEDAKDAVPFLEECRLKYPFVRANAVRALEKILPSASFNDMEESEEEIKAEEGFKTDKEIPADEIYRKSADSVQVNYSSVSDEQNNDSFETDKTNNEAIEGEEEVKKQNIIADPDEYILY
jgi:HEAT repeat protein